MCTSDEDLLFFPTYQSILHNNENLRVVWFERTFSQSHYNYERTTNGSNACTIIAILVAAKICFNRIKISGPDKFTTEMVYVLGRSMLEGNKLHETLKSKGTLDNINLTVPEAIQFAGKSVAGLTEWKSMLYLEALSSSLYGNMKKNIKDWVKSIHFKNHPDLYVVLITEARSVLFIIQDATDTVSVIDSHQHSGNKGALIATAKRMKMKLLCQWFVQMLEEYYQTNPELYELSFLYFQNKKRNRCN